MRNASVRPGAAGRPGTEGQCGWPGGGNRTSGTEGRPGETQIRFRLGPGNIIETSSNGWFPVQMAHSSRTDLLDPKDARVQGFQHLQVRFGDGPWQDVKGLDEVGSDTGRTGMT
ncbi:phage tail fiber C-terminal domain-containing protein [Escherichia coli]|uniref:phage tail fiber C-terminal domain-containing protein n=1 Tax=Escherichia coli TaxID=562 RepID=UPI003CC90DC7